MLHLSAALTVFVIFSSVMAAEKGGWYVSGNISYVDINDADLDSNEVTTGSRKVVASFDEDTGYGLSFGYEFASNFLGPIRLGVEYQNHENDADKIDFQNIARANVDGSTEVNSIFVNFTQAFDGLLWHSTLCWSWFGICRNRF